MMELTEIIFLFYLPLTISSHLRWLQAVVTLVYVGNDPGSGGTSEVLSLYDTIIV